MKGKYNFIALLAILALMITGCFDNTPVDLVVPETPDPVEVVDPEPVTTPPLRGKIAPRMVTAIDGIEDHQLGYPIAAHQDAQGNTFILDLYSTDGIIKVFDPQGNFKGKSISLPSPKSQITDFALDDGGNIYIADLDMGAVQKYFDGELVDIYGPMDNFHPRSVAVDSHGNLWVVSFDRIYRFTPEGESAFFGGSGKGEGEFGTAGSEFYIGPSSLCIDGDDNIYIADTLNQRIQKFDGDGRFLELYTLGEGVRPEAVWVSENGSIYVASGEGLAKLDSQGEWERAVEISPWGKKVPEYYNIGGGEGEILLVAIPETHQVKVFSEDIEVYSLLEDTKNGFIYPHDLAIHGGHIAIVAGDPFYEDEMNHRAVLFDDDGTFVTHLLSDYGSGSFSSPKSVAYYDGHWHVLDLDIISVFSSQGQFVTSFGGRGAELGDFGVYYSFGQDEGPFDMISGVDGLIVSDTYNDRIQSVDQRGRYLGDFKVNHPGAIASDAAGNIYVVETQRSAVVKYSPTGKSLLEFGGRGEGEGRFAGFNLEGMVLGPAGIAVDPSDGYIYVSDTQAHGIQVFDPSGEYIQTLGSFEGSAGDRLFNPGGLAFDDGGFLWVADTGNHRVIQWDLSTRSTF